MKRTRSSTSVADRMLDLAAECFDAATLDALAKLRLRPQLAARVDRLAEKANEGELTPREHAEYQAYIRTSELLTLLQLRAFETAPVNVGRIRFANSTYLTTINRRFRALFPPVRRRYDSGMTTSKIAITLPEEQLARVHRQIRAGRADSVSGYIARALAEQERQESLRDILDDLIAQHGKPTQEDKKWAKRALASRRRG